MGDWRPTAIRRRYRFGPKWLHVFVNTSRAHMLDVPRMTSWGWAVFGGKYSRNVTRGTETVDTPGPGSWRRRRGGRRG